MKARTCKSQVITATRSLVHVLNDSLQRYGLVLQGSQTQRLATAPTGETSTTILEQRCEGSSESRELQLRQLAVSLFLIRILIKFNAYICVLVRQSSRTVPYTNLQFPSNKCIRYTIILILKWLNSLNFTEIKII